MLPEAKIQHTEFWAFSRSRCWVLLSPDVLGVATAFCTGSVGAMLDRSQWSDTSIMGFPTVAHSVTTTLQPALIYPIRAPVGSKQTPTFITAPPHYNPPVSRRVSPRKASVTTSTSPTPNLFGPQTFRAFFIRRRRIGAKQPVPYDRLRRANRGRLTRPQVCKAKRS